MTTALNARFTTRVSTPQIYTYTISPIGNPSSFITTPLRFGRQYIETPFGGPATVTTRSTGQLWPRSDTATEETGGASVLLSTDAGNQAYLGSDGGIYVTKIVTYNDLLHGAH